MEQGYGLTVRAQCSPVSLQIAEASVGRRRTGSGCYLSCVQFTYSASFAQLLLLQYHNHPCVGSVVMLASSSVTAWISVHRLSSSYDSLTNGPRTEELN